MYFMDKATGSLEIAKIFCGVSFATLAHHGQMRGGERTPYVNHVFDVARRVSERGFTDVTTILAALLHDVVEDTPHTIVQIRDTFGDSVAEIVDHLTLPVDAQKDKSLKIAYQLSKMDVMDSRGRAIKIADKTSNVYDMFVDPPGWTASGVKAYADSSRRVVHAALGDPQVRILIDDFEEAYEVVSKHYNWSPT